MTAIQSATPYLALSGGALTGNLTIDGNAHLMFTGTAPSAVAGSNAGTSPPNPVVVTGSNDPAGTVTFGTGTLPASGVMVAVTFNQAWVIPGGGAPHIVISPINVATQALNIYVSGASPTGFNLSCVNAPSAGQANTVYGFSFVVMG